MRSLRQTKKTYLLATNIPLNIQNWLATSFRAVFPKKSSSDSLVYMEAKLPTNKQCDRRFRVLGKEAFFYLELSDLSRTLLFWASLW
jgi:hypothetical protein